MSKKREMKKIIEILNDCDQITLEAVRKALEGVIGGSYGHKKRYCKNG